VSAILAEHAEPGSTQIAKSQRRKAPRRPLSAGEQLRQYAQSQQRPDHARLGKVGVAQGVVDQARRRCDGNRVPLGGIRMRDE
jgi:hypothetical protein